LGDGQQSTVSNQPGSHEYRELTSEKLEADKLYINALLQGTFYSWRFNASLKKRTKRGFVARMMAA
jgi:hypothetical protein